MNSNCGMEKKLVQEKITSLPIKWPRREIGPRKKKGPKRGEVLWKEGRTRESFAHGGVPNREVEVQTFKRESENKRLMAERKRPRLANVHN